MTEIIKDEQMSENSAIDNLVAEYQAVARKSCRSILEVAKCVHHARNVLSIKSDVVFEKSDFHAYLERIDVEESYAKKLYFVADYESEIKDFLCRSNTEMSLDEMFVFAKRLDYDATYECTYR
jgi:hypothetical protein